MPSWKRSPRLPLIHGVLAFVFCAAAARPQYSAGFEQMNASPAGTPLAGQAGFFLPAPGDAPFDVYSYSGNTLGLPANPEGGANFIAGMGPGNNVLARAQRNVGFGSGNGLWTLRFDVLVHYAGAGASAQSIGGFSLQPVSNPPSRSFVALAQWTNPAAPTSWNVEYIRYNGGGAQMTSAIPAPGFQNLLVDRWYRWETDFSFEHNRILSVRVRDLVTGAIARHHPANWFLAGGQNPVLPLPSAIRFAAGSTTASGNLMAFDNLSLRPRALLLMQTTLGATTTTITVLVSDGPPAGVASMYASFQTGPPAYLFPPSMIEPLWLDPSNYFFLDSIPLDGNGMGSTAYILPFPITAGVIVQAAASSASAIEITPGEKIDITDTPVKASLTYNTGTGAYAGSVVGGTSGVAVQVQKLDTSGAATTVGSTTTNASGEASIAGEISSLLKCPEGLRLLYNGSVCATWSFPSPCP